MTTRSVAPACLVVLVLAASAAAGSADADLLPEDLARAGDAGSTAAAADPKPMVSATILSPAETPSEPAAAAGDQAAGQDVAGGAHYTTPAFGSSERREIMDAARVPVMNALGQPVIFQASVLRTDGTWCYLQAVPLGPDGGPFDWSKTPLAREWAADAMSEVIMVLLRREGSGWRVVDHVIGPTDVHWVGWLDQYGLPEALFNPRS